MGFISDFRYRKISHTATVNDLLKELFRKSIHICSSLVPFLAAWQYSATVLALSFTIVFYILCEYNRLNGSAIPIVSRVTAYAARRRDEGRFVLGPVTMGLGVLLTLVLFPPDVARVGIMALAFGDGIASLAGKVYGRIRIPGAQGKTLEGSTACFVAVYVSSIFILRDPLMAFETALLAMLIEVLPLKDYDNLIIPLAISAFVLVVA